MLGDICRYGGVIWVVIQVTVESRQESGPAFDRACDVQQHNYHTYFIVNKIWNLGPEVICPILLVVAQHVDRIIYI